MICPSCQLTDIAEGARICPNCGDVLGKQAPISEQALQLIKEKSVLKGNIVEYKMRAEQHEKKISQLRTYVVLLVLLLPLSHFLCNKKPDISLSDYSSATFNQFATEQFRINKWATAELLRDEPAFLYITTYGDNPESLSLLFYGTRIYADTLIRDNYINNDRRMPTGDTLLLRKNPKMLLPNALKIKNRQKTELNEGNTKHLWVWEE